MPSLHDCQAGFAALLLDEEAASPDWFEPGNGHWGRYRDSLRGVMAGALADIHPVTRRVLGAACFEAVATDYLHGHPSACGDLHRYGEAFADYAGLHAATESLPYLTDLLRLEWTIHRMFHAADACALHLADLSTEMKSLKPHPACRLLACDFPVQRIWQAHQQAVVPTEIDIAGGPQAVLVSRPGFEVWVTPLPQPEAELMAALLSGMSLESACAKMLDGYPGCDLATMLYALIEAGSFMG